MEIRRLTELDAEPMWNLRLRALESEPTAFGEAPEEHRASTPQHTADRLRQGGDAHQVFGAFENGTLAGMIGLYRIDRIKRCHKAAIWGMYVEQAHRGKGAGRLLLDEAIRAARAMPGVRLLNLSVITTNRPALQLYLSAGFRVYGTEANALKVGERFYEEEFMVLEL